MHAISGWGKKNQFPKTPPDVHAEASDCGLLPRYLFLPLALPSPRSSRREIETRNGVALESAVTLELGRDGPSTAPVHAGEELVSGKVKLPLAICTPPPAHLRAGGTDCPYKRMRKSISSTYLQTYGPCSSLKSSCSSSARFVPVSPPRLRRLVLVNSRSLSITHDSILGPEARIGAYDRGGVVDRLLCVPTAVLISPF